MPRFIQTQSHCRCTGKVISKFLLLPAVVFWLISELVQPRESFFIYLAFNYYYRWKASTCFIFNLLIWHKYWRFCDAKFPDPSSANYAPTKHFFHHSALPPKTNFDIKCHSSIQENVSSSLPLHHLPPIACTSALCNEQHKFVLKKLQTTEDFKII